MSGEEGERWGFYNYLCSPEALLEQAQTYAQQLANGPTVAHALTKKMLHQEWDMPLGAAIDAEAIAQAECMQTKDFHRAYHAFVDKKKPEFKGD